MAYDQKAKEQSIKYIKNNQKRIQINWLKSDFETRVEPAIEKTGKKVGTFFKEAVEEKLEREGLCGTAPINERKKVEIFESGDMIYSILPIAKGGFMVCRCLLPDEDPEDYKDKLVNVYNAPRIENRYNVLLQTTESYLEAKMYISLFMKGYEKKT